MVTKFATVALLAALFLVPEYAGCAQRQGKAIVISKASRKGWLGVQVQDVTKKLRSKEGLSVDRGAYVSQVVDDSPADKAGILEGDVIVMVGKDTIDDSGDLTEAVGALKPKSEVTIEVVRKTEHHELTAKLGRSPQDILFGALPNLPHTRTYTPFSNFSVFTRAELYGLQLQSLTSQLGEYFEAPDGKGLLVTEVEKGSSAEKAGFKAGDVITKVDKHTVKDIDDFRDEVSDKEEGTVPVEVVRKGKPLTLTLSVESESGDEESFFAPDANRDAFTYRFSVPPHRYRIDLSPLKEGMRELREKLRELRSTLRQEVRDL